MVCRFRKKIGLRDFDSEFESRTLKYNLRPTPNPLFYMWKFKITFVWINFNRYTQEGTKHLCIL